MKPIQTLSALTDEIKATSAHLKERPGKWTLAARQVAALAWPVLSLGLVATSACIFIGTGFSLPAIIAVSCVAGLQILSWTLDAWASRKKQALASELRSVFATAAVSLKAEQATTLAFRLKAYQAHYRAAGFSTQQASHILEPISRHHLVKQESKRLKKEREAQDRTPLNLILDQAPFALTAHTVTDANLSLFTEGSKKRLDKWVKIERVFDGLRVLPLAAAAACLVIVALVQHVPLIIASSCFLGAAAITYATRLAARVQLPSLAWLSALKSKADKARLQPLPSLEEVQAFQEEARLHLPHKLIDTSCFPHKEKQPLDTFWTVSGTGLLDAFLWNTRRQQLQASSAELNRSLACIHLPQLADLFQERAHFSQDAETLALADPGLTESLKPLFVKIITIHRTLVRIGEEPPPLETDSTALAKVYPQTWLEAELDKTMAICKRQATQTLA